MNEPNISLSLVKILRHFCKAKPNEVFGENLSNEHLTTSQLRVVGGNVN